MRWHCLDPELPDKAVLRIRTAPNADATVCGRVSKGKAIGAVAPEFEIADAADGTAEVPPRWLHVAFIDELTSESAEGYVMAAMPNGMRLLVPWEEANCINCCRVLNAHAQLFDGPSAAAPVVGFVSEGEGVRYPYAVLGVDGSRAHILHDVFDDVWIDIAELEPMCVHLRHANCSAPHAFFTLNDELPPEAQIAIRAFPSKDAEALGLLSRGEAVEVVARSGSWLQIAPTRYENGESDESWIMWETGAWTLLVEAVDHSSSACSTHRAEPLEVDEDDDMVEDAADDIALTDDLLTVQQHDDCNTFANESVEAAAASESFATGASAEDTVVHASYAGDTDTADELPDAVSGTASSVASTSWDDRPLNVRSNRVQSAGTSSSSETTTAITSESSEHSHSALQTTLGTTGASWDEQPIRPLPAPCLDDLDDVASTNEDSGTGLEPAVLNVAEHAADDTVMMEATDEEPASIAILEISTTSESSAALWDEVPVGGSSRPVASAWDEVPVGGGSKSNPSMWDEYPPGEQCEVNSAADNEGSTDAVESNDNFDGEDAADVDAFAVPMAVDDDETSASATPDAHGAEDVALLYESSTALPWDDVPVGGTRSAANAWDDVPVGGGSERAANAWDEVPVGSSKRGPSVWDEYPPDMKPVIEVENSVDVALLVPDCGAHSVVDADDIEGVVGGEGADADAFAEPTAVDDEVNASATPDAHGTEDVPSTSDPSTPAPRDEVPVGSGSERASSAWDEVPVGSSKRGPCVWDEYPSGELRAVETESNVDVAQPDNDGDADDVADSDDRDDGDGGDSDDDEFAEPMTLDDDDDHLGASEAGDVPVKATERVPPPPASPTLAQHNTTPVDGSAWDEVPVGSSSKRGPNVWDEYPSEVDTAPRNESVVELDDVTTTATAARSSSREVASSASWLESHCADAAMTNACGSVGDEKGKMTLADLMDERGNDPLVGTGVDRDLHHHDGVDDSTTLPAADAALLHDAEQVLDIRHDRCNTSEADRALTIEDTAAEDMLVDDAHVSILNAPAWNESPIKATARFYEDTTMDVASNPIDDDDDVDEKRDVNDVIVLTNDHMQNTSMSTNQRASSNASPTNRDAQRSERAPVLKRALSGTTVRSSRSFAASRQSANGASFPSRRARKPEFAHADADSGGLSFLLEFGLRAYCRHKQILITASDDASQALFQAVVYGDDPEQILETLTADESLSADWMLYSAAAPTSTGVPTPSSAAHMLLDVLYARDASSVPSTPQPIVPPLVASTCTSQRTPPHASGARKEKIDRMFNRTPANERATPTYDLIMNDADADAILEAEFGDETCELTILGPYKYPTLSASRSVPAVSRSPINDYSASGSTMMRFSSAYQLPVAAIASESEATSASAAGHPLLCADAVAPARSLTPPSALTPNRLKRAASAITKTPPVPLARTASSSSLPSPTAADTSSVRPATTGLPPPSRFGARSSSATRIGMSSALRRPSPPPVSSAVAANTTSAAPRPRSSLTSEPSSLTTARSSLTGTLPKPVRTASSSLLQRKSFLPSASPGAPVPLASRRETMAGPSVQASGGSTSSLLTRRTSFGFARPKATAALQPKKP